MSEVNLKKYGLNLAGRPYGITTYSIIVNDFEAPYELNFEGVYSIGSSFADEVVAKLATSNGGEIKILNAGVVVKKCLVEVEEEKGLTFNYEP